MVTSPQAYVLAYAEVGSTVDGWVTTDIGGDFPAGGGQPFIPMPPPTIWTISWFTADNSTLATVQIDATTGDIVP
jgi:hypothetical protein